MKFRPHHPQHIAAAKAGFSERTARRMTSNRHLAVPPIAIRSRRVADPFDGLWDREIRPMLEAHPGFCVYNAKTLLRLRAATRPRRTRTR